MSPLFIHEGKLLVQNNQLAASQDCCCSGCLECSDSCTNIITYSVGLPSGSGVGPKSFTLSTGYDFYQTYEEDGDFLLGDISAECSGCVWKFTLFACWESDLLGNTEYWEGTIEANNDGCLDMGQSIYMEPVDPPSYLTVSVNVTT